MENKEQIIIIGCGPVGLAIGLLLVKKNYKNIKIYEARKEIPNNMEESYPIGINPRALNCLELINGELKQKAIDQSLIINSWDIYGGSRRVASMESTTVYGTTRGGINLMLYEEALKYKEIEIKFNHKLIGIDFQNKILKFENNGIIIEKDGKESRIIGCDGVHSKVRREMQEQKINGFISESKLWSSEHRVLFSKSGISSTKLDEKVHYIFNGCYTAVVKRSNGDQLWTLVTAAFDKSPKKERELLLSYEASEENVLKLRKLLIEKSGKEVSDLFEEEELKRYFQRRTFRGAVVHCNRLHEGEWIVLLGDAAHSVLPPVGEGINSGLEDTVILSMIMDNSNAPFQHYNKTRLPDIIGLGKIADYLNTSNASSSPEKVS